MTCSNVFIDGDYTGKIRCIVEKPFSPVRRATDMCEFRLNNAKQNGRNEANKHDSKRY